MATAKQRRMVVGWLRAASRGPEPHLSDVVVAALDRLDLRVLGEVATAQRIAPWVVAALDAAGRGDAADVSGLRHIATWQAVTGLQLDHVLHNVIEGFAAGSLPAIVLKGPAVARYYPRADLRPYNDLDLLIREEDEHEAHAVLEALGFAQVRGETRDPLHHDHAKFQAIFQRPDGCIIDLHRDHLQIGLRPLTLDEVWASSTEGPWGDAVRLLEAHDQFVLLAVHLQRHNFERLLWFKDLDLMIRTADLDWDRVAAIARTEGCTSVVGYALLLLEAVLGTPLPEGARRLTRERSRFARFTQALLWPMSSVLTLEPGRKWRWRRAIQFAPETGVFRGGLPSLVTWGRRGAKARIMLSALTQRGRGAGKSTSA